MITCVGLKCASEDCIYFAGKSPDGCSFKNVYLQKGICRYYKSRTEIQLSDRTDLPGGNYVNFVNDVIEEMTESLGLAPDIPVIRVT